MSGTKSQAVSVWFHVSGMMMLLDPEIRTEGLSFNKQSEDETWMCMRWGQAFIELQWRRQWHPTPVLLPGKSHGWRSLVGCSPWGLWGPDMTEWLHFHTLEKGMATHSSVPAWRIPGTGEPGGLPSMGLHRVGHDWSDLAAVAARPKRWESRSLPGTDPSWAQAKFSRETVVSSRPEGISILKKFLLKKNFQLK